MTKEQKQQMLKDFRCEITLRWNLLQDDLLLQEESVIDFIYSLLKKEL